MNEMILTKRQATELRAAFRRAGFVLTYHGRDNGFTNTRLTLRGIVVIALTTEDGTRYDIHCYWRKRFDPKVAHVIAGVLDGVALPSGRLGR